MKVFDIHANTPQGPCARDQQAFLIGIDFHECAIRAGYEVRDPAGRPIVALCPMIVCYAFAAELYLKSLISIEIKNHRLNLLYDRLDTDSRNIISNCYQARTGRDVEILKNDLRAFATAFKDWRYVFEGEGQQIKANLLIAFTKSAYETIRQKKPHWDVPPTQHARLLADEENPTMTVANIGGGTFLHIVDGTGGTLSTPSV